MSAKHTPVQFGMTAGADFEANTMTLEMEPGYIVAVGPVAVLPLSTYEELLEALTRIAAFDEYEPAGPAARTARAAIAKATGSAA